MNRFLVSIALLIMLSFFAGNALSKELIREFKGTGSKTTAEFKSSRSIPVLRTIASRVARHLERQGLLERDSGNPFASMVGEVAIRPVLT